MSTFFGSAYFDSVVDANVVDACVVLLPPMPLPPQPLLLPPLLSTVVVLIRVLLTLLPLPSSRCSFGEWTAAVVDDEATVFDLIVHTDALSVVSCLSSVELDCEAVIDAVAEFTTDTATESIFCVSHAFTFCPCSNDVDADGTLHIGALLCCIEMGKEETERKKEKKKAHNSKKPMRIYITYIFRAILSLVCNWIICLLFLWSYFSNW